MRILRSAAWWSLIPVSLWFWACGGGSQGEGDAGGSGSSATGGFATATGGSGAGATATGGAPVSEAAGTGGQLESDAGASSAGAGGTDDPTPASGGSTGGSLTAGGSAGDCEPLAPAGGTVFDGDVYLTTPADVEDAQQYSEITGSLQVLATLELLDVELPRLQRLGGDLTADSTKLRSILAPRLESLDGQLWLYLNYDLLEIDLRNLAQIGGRVFIHRNRTLRVLQLEALVSVDGADGVAIDGNLDLPDCFLDVIDQRFTILHTSAPECICTRGCGLVEADCP